MAKDTHCAAKLLCGENWQTAKVTATTSGTPYGVLCALFRQLATKDPEAAKLALENLPVIMANVQDVAVAEVVAKTTPLPPFEMMA